MCPSLEFGLSLPTSVDLFVKSCVGFTIYFHCYLSVSSINSLNIIDGWSILFIFLFLPLCRCVPVGICSKFFSSIPKHLQPIAFLVRSRVLGSKVDDTVRTYLVFFRRWKHWATSNHVCLFPANTFQVAICLQSLPQDANSPSPVLNAVNSIYWAQRMAGLSKISDHPLVSLMVSASQTLLGRPKVEKVTPEMLKALMESKIPDNSSCISDLRSFALCTIDYTRFYSVLES